MLSSKTIDKVKELPILEVIQKYVELKKSGATWKGKSPFTDEKSGSFMVSEPKNFWKCFSTGIGGSNAVSFIMKKEKIEWLEAIKKLAHEYSIPLEYDDSERAAKYQEQQAIISQLSDINSAAMDFWASHLKEVTEEFIRSVESTNEKFYLGYAPNEWNALHSHLMKLGYSNKQMLDAGLISEGQKGVFDTFRGRVMFPIYDKIGKIIGFSGRLAIKVDDPKKTPKVINSKETQAFSKSTALLGLFQAKTDIARLSKAILVEGNYDVTSMHQSGFLNTVASLGTAFTDEHCKLLKKSGAKSICFFIDNDKAGKAKIEHNALLALENGLHATIFIPEIENHDPDNWCNEIEFNQDVAQELFKKGEIDAVQYLAQQYFDKKESIVEITEAQNQLSKLLACVENASLRNNYVREFAKKYKIDKVVIEKQVSIELLEKNNHVTEENQKVKIPAHLDEDEKTDFKEFGFYPEKSKDKLGYYFMGQYGAERVSNWTMKPLFHVLDQRDSKRYIELTTVRGKLVVEVSNSKMNSPQAFEDTISNTGPNYFNGSKKQYQRLKAKYLLEFPMCNEIKTLGWYYDGFFAFANGIVEAGNFKKADDYGLVSFGTNKYFLPAFSSIYKSAKADDDLYESDRRFVYRSANVGFESWAKKFNSVYKDNHNGMFVISFLAASLFSDFIYKENGFFPLVIAYGQPRTGKSTCGRSVSRIFKGESTPFNLHSGTVTGFQRVLSRVRNIIEHLDEYRNDMDEKRFQSLKGIWDRTGSIKGQMSQDNRTIETKINSCAYISGQHIPTRDGNALFSRGITLEFNKLQDKFTTSEVKEYNELTKMEEKGLSDVIVEVIRFRQLVEEMYAKRQFEIGSKLRDEFADESVDGRVTSNFLVLLTIVDILKDSVRFPFTYENLYKVSKQYIISQSKMIQESDELAEFFAQIEFLSLQHAIVNGQDYKLESGKYDLKVGRGSETEIKKLDKVDVLYIKMAKVFPLYKETIRRQGNQGLDQQTIISYMKTHKAYIGNVKSVRFDEGSTSAFAFDYALLGISLAGLGNEDANKPTSQQVNHHTPAIQNAQQSDIDFEKEEEDMPF